MEQPENNSIPGQQLIPSSPSSQQIQPTQPPRKNIFPRVLLAIFLISLITIGIMLALKATQPSPRKITQNTSPSSSQTQPSTQSPAEKKWKTYTNDSDKFSLTYPPNYQIKESSIGMGVETIEFRTAANLNTQYGADMQILILPKLLGNAVGQDFDKYYKMDDNSTVVMKNPQGGESQQLTKISNRTINNQRAFDFLTSPEGNSQESAIGTYIELGSNLLIISTTQANKPTLESMLATFQYMP